MNNYHNYIIQNLIKNNNSSWYIVKIKNSKFILSKILNLYIYVYVCILEKRMCRYKDNWICSSMKNNSKIVDYYI